MIPHDKPYILFGGDCYYPNGGYNDYIGTFDTIERATVDALNRYGNGKGGTWHDRWWHIVDVTRGVIVLTDIEYDRAQGKP